MSRQQAHSQRTGRECRPIGRPACSCSQIDREYAMHPDWTLEHRMRLADVQVSGLQQKSTASTPTSSSLSGLSAAMPDGPIQPAPCKPALPGCLRQVLKRSQSMNKGMEIPSQAMRATMGTAGWTVPMPNLCAGSARRHTGPGPPGVPTEMRGVPPAPRGVPAGAGLGSGALSPPQHSTCNTRY